MEPFSLADLFGRWLSTALTLLYRKELNNKTKKVNLHVFTFMYLYAKKNLNAPKFSIRDTFYRNMRGRAIFG